MAYSCPHTSNHGCTAPLSSKSLPGLVRLDLNRGSVAQYASTYAEPKARSLAVQLQIDYHPSARKSSLAHLRQHTEAPGFQRKSRASLLVRQSFRTVALNQQLVIHRNHHHSIQTQAS